MYCSECQYQDYIPIDEDVYLDRLNGEGVYGIYPLCEDDTTYLLLFDFDDYNNKNEDFANKDNGWKEEVNALRKICEIEKIPCLVERSRFGYGVHVCFIFDKSIFKKLNIKLG